MDSNFVRSTLPKSLVAVGVVSIGSGLVASNVGATDAETIHPTPPESSNAATQSTKLSETRSLKLPKSSTNEAFVKPEFSGQRTGSGAIDALISINEILAKPEFSTQQGRSANRTLVADGTLPTAANMPASGGVAADQTLPIPVPPPATPSASLPAPPPVYASGILPIVAGGNMAAPGYAIAPFNNYPINPYPVFYPGYPTYFSAGVPFYPIPYAQNPSVGLVPTLPPNPALPGTAGASIAATPFPYPAGTPANYPPIVYPPIYPPTYPMGMPSAAVYPGGVPGGYPGYFPGYSPYFQSGYPPTSSTGYPAYPYPAPAATYPAGTIGYPIGTPTFPTGGYAGYPGALPPGFPGTLPNPLGTNSAYPTNSPVAPVAPVSQAQAIDQNQPGAPSFRRSPVGSSALSSPSLQVQGVAIYQGNEFSARARLTGAYPLTPRLMFGATLDLTTGNAFTDSPNSGFSVNELYLAGSFQGLPTLRFALGQLDLTSYFDRNSFAKDGATQFFNPIFQTNPALSATGIGSRPAFLVNWRVTDNIETKAAIFSSSRNIGNFALDGFAGEVGLRFGNAIIRGTYATDRDAGNRDGFDGIFQINRGLGRTGVLRGDREEAFGVNGEVFIPNLKMGLFARYGRQNNLTLGRGGDTYNFGVNFLDLLMPGDRLGVAYGRGLSNETLRRRSGNPSPDALEVFYDFRVAQNLRLGFSLQQRDNFHETILGVRLKTEFDVFPARN
jgi:hypothetical protein